MEDDKMAVKERNIVMCIILTFVTCVIYGLYWAVCLQDDSNALANDFKTSGVMVVVLSIVTCGIYAIYWAYKMGEKLDAVKQSRGIPASNSGILYVILYLVTGGIVSYALMQNEINKLV